jgi:protein involved in polysaccharide export with SLBB domain
MARNEVEVNLTFDPPVQRIEVLRLEPGDVLAVTVQDHLSAAEFERLRQSFNTGYLAERGVKVMILERATLSVIRPVPEVPDGG